MTEKPCRWVAKDQPRLLRTHLRDCDSSGCDGCEPCPEPHCPTCGRTHSREVCTICVGHVRNDLRQIVDMDERMLTEAVHRGVDSEATNLAGPAADPEAWSWRKVAARQGKAWHVSLEHDDDAKAHALWVLGTWDMLVTEHLGHTRTQRVTIPTAAQYLAANLTDLARAEDFAFEELAREVRDCRAHYEDVLTEGERDQRGVKCPMCGKAHLVKDYGEKVADDRWRCQRKDCTASYTDHDYRAKVEADYADVADRLTASRIARHYRVPEGTVRRWANGDSPTVRKLGYDGQGRQLYAVADVLASRDAATSRVDRVS